MFFKSIEDFKAYLPVNASFAFGEIKIFLDDCDRTTFKRYLGKTFLASLQTDFNAAATAVAIAEPKKTLVEHLRVASANLAMAKWITHGQVNISQNGVTVTFNDSEKPAHQWQIKDIQASCNETGMNALEEALEYLEDNIDNAAFAAYKASDEFKENNYLFVRTAADFQRYFSGLDCSRVNFYKMRSTIRKVEDFEIRSVLLPDYFADLKTKLQEGEALGTNAQRIVDMIKPALVNLTVAKGINDLAVVINDKGVMVFDNTAGRQTVDAVKTAGADSLARIANRAEFDGKTYLKRLADYLETNKADYPLFANDIEYIAPEDVPERNDGEVPFYNAI
jgi:hypothetical protein